VRRPPDSEERRPREEAPFTTRTIESEPQSTAFDDLDLVHHAWVSGYDHGLVDGQRLAAEHLAHDLLHRQAAEVVSCLSDIPQRDREADRAAAARREARWSR
jgi:hypothetical protein